MDWEDSDYNYQGEPGAGAGGGPWRQAVPDSEDPLAALLAGIPDFSTEDLEALLRDLPTPDDDKQPAGMTMEEAVEVSDMLYVIGYT